MIFLEQNSLDYSWIVWLSSILAAVEGNWEIWLAQCHSTRPPLAYLRSGRCLLVHGDDPVSISDGSVVLLGISAETVITNFGKRHFN